MSGNTFAFLLLVASAAGMALLVYAFVRNSLRSLLEDTLKLPAATAFYLRALLVMVLAAVLSQAVEKAFRLEAGARFIEYVWAFAERLSAVLVAFLLVWVAYLLLVTLLALPRSRE